MTPLRLLGPDIEHLLSQVVAYCFNAPLEHAIDYTDGAWLHYKSTRFMHFSVNVVRQVI